MRSLALKTKDKSKKTKVKNPIYKIRLGGTKRQTHIRFSEIVPGDHFYLVPFVIYLFFFIPYFWQLKQ
jgi:hypothetical protein